MYLIQASLKSTERPWATFISPNCNDLKVVWSKVVAEVSTIKHNSVFEYDSLLSACINLSLLIIKRTQMGSLGQVSNF